MTMTSALEHSSVVPSMVQNSRIWKAKKEFGGIFDRSILKTSLSKLEANTNRSCTLVLISFLQEAMVHNKFCVHESGRLPIVDLRQLPRSSHH